MIFTLLKTFLVVTLVTAASKMETLCTKFFGTTIPGNYTEIRQECDVVFVYTPSKSSVEPSEICEDMLPWRSIKSSMNGTHLQCRFRWFYECDEDEISLFDFCYSVIDGEFTYDDGVKECKKDKRNLTLHSLNYPTENFWLSYFFPEHKALWVKGNGSMNTVIRPRGNFLKGVRFGGVEEVPPTMKGSALCSRKANVMPHSMREQDMRDGLLRYTRGIKPQHVYYVYEESWRKYNYAEEVCTWIGGHLPSIHSVEEVNLIKSLIDHYDYRRYWTGLSRNYSIDPSRWYWSDGSAVDFTLGPWEPDSSKEDCVLWMNDEWSDRYCFSGFTAPLPCKVESFRIPCEKKKC